MYKILLCWRYLLTRFIALASVISVTLGVATLIVVNSVMLGFQTKMHDQIHGILSDVTIRSRSLDGFPDPEVRMAQLRKIAGEMIEGMTPTVITPAILMIKVGNQSQPVQVDVIGVDLKTQGAVCDLAKFLQHPENRQAPTFDLKESGYDTRSSLNLKDSSYREAMDAAGWLYRRQLPSFAHYDESRPNPGVTDPLVSLQPVDPLAGLQPSTQSLPKRYDPSREQRAGLFLGIGLTAYARQKTKNPDTGKTELTEEMMMIPGDDVLLAFPSLGKELKFNMDRFTITDIYDCNMSQYNDKFVFVPIERLQELSGMIDPMTGVRYASQILIKAKPGVDINKLRDTIKESTAFPPYAFAIETWRDQQSTLIDAVSTEISILNVLLFLIIAVAGFGILAIFYMIVVEKIRDIGILKSLGAGSAGIMQIFLCYSLVLGLLGAGVGTVIGILIVNHIDAIADGLAVLLGHEVFDSQIYYFTQIPTLIEPLMVVKVLTGSVLIAVLSGVLPALRAARLHPVKALRYE
ncbi:MAG: ABC transporter permease [Planctomycetaceae bacterium]|jgi:lipoprotein-releasing system permease protein|nr:ABC transporter permease [Planctomycetaceae bacterium]